MFFIISHYFMDIDCCDQCYAIEIRVFISHSYIPIGYILLAIQSFKQLAYERDNRS